MPSDLPPLRQPTWWEGRQEVLNARPVPERRLQRAAQVPISVRARVVWAKDGEEQVVTSCTAWTSRLVLVDLVDARCRVRAVWLDPADVERVSPRGDG